MDDFVKKIELGLQREKAEKILNDTYSHIDLKNATVMDEQSIKE